MNSSVFNYSSRLGSDQTDVSQKTLSNTRLSNYNLANYFSNPSNESFIQFSTNQPAMSFNGSSRGNGVNRAYVDSESFLLMKKTQERPLEKLSLQPRMFVTIPYSARGGADPLLESQLQQGELFNGKKSVNTISEQSFLNHVLVPSSNTMTEQNRPQNMIEESALEGWTHGGIPTRELFSTGGVDNKKVNLNFKYL